MFDKQMVFDKAYKALYDQNKRSLIGIRGMEFCAYRSPDGSKCAVGHLIPDEKYNASLEKLSARTHAILEACGFPDNVACFLANMQFALHDGLSDESDFREQLVEAARNFAKQNGLAFNE